MERPICPHYRIRQLITIGGNTTPATATCTALETEASLNRADALSTCLTASHRQCARFNGIPSPPASSVSEHPTPQGRVRQAAISAVEPAGDISLPRQIFWSLFWVITIPVIITALIVLALFLTEWFY